MTAMAFLLSLIVLNIVQTNKDILGENTIFHAIWRTTLYVANLESTHILLMDSNIRLWYYFY